jgi:hypothetical protein
MAPLLRREDKFGYGFLLASIGAPIVIFVIWGDKLAAAVVGSILVVVGFTFIIAGHRHKDSPQKRGIMATILMFIMVGAAMGASAGLLSGLAFLALKHKQPEVPAERREVTGQPPKTTEKPTTSPEPLKPAPAPRKNLVRAERIPKQSFESPEVRQALAQQLATLSQDVEEFSKNRQKIEDALPAVDPALPSGKANQPWQLRENYYRDTRSKFHFNGLEFRCEQIMQALSNRADLAEDVNFAEESCRQPFRVRELKLLSASLAKLAQKVQEPPK